MLPPRCTDLIEMSHNNAVGLISGQEKHAYPIRCFSSFNSATLKGGGIKREVNK